MTHVVDSSGNIKTASTTGSAAPIGAQYVTLSANGTLTDERVLTAGEGIDLTDAGAGSTITVSGEDASDTNKGIASFDATDFTVTTGNVVLNAERVSDIVGSMVTGNTETRITVTYQDADNTLDFELDTSVVDATGTPADNQIAVFTDANTIEGTSGLTFSGTTLSLAGSASSGADIKLYEDTDNGSHSISLKAPASLAADVVLTLPTTDGDASQFLQTDGSGVLSWATGGGGTPGGSNTQLQFNDSSAFGGDAGLTYDKTGNILTCDTQIVIGGNATAQGSLKLLEDTDNGSNYIIVQPPAAITANTTLTLPDGAGASGQVMKTNGSGNLSWSTIDTDWVAYTPTFTGFGTASSVQVWSRRVGNSIEIRGRFTAGTSTATEARMTLGYAGTSANISSSNTIISSLQYCGVAAVSYNGTNVFGVVVEANLTYVTFSVATTGRNLLTKMDGNVFLASGDTAAFAFAVPIDTWP